MVCSRQNFKTFCAENLTLTRLLAPGPPRLVVWSAHEVATAQETFRTFVEMAETNPWVGSKVKSIGRATGREAIEFLGGRRLRFRARIKTGGRGLAGDGIVLDEAFALMPAHMGSLLPILSTKRKAWVLYGSSAPQASSGVLRSVMARGRAGGPGALAYVEYAAPGSQAEPPCLRGADCQHKVGTPGCSLDDERLWVLANPAVTAGRITLEYLRQERAALDPWEFMRERLGWGDPEAGGLAVPMEQWEALRDPDSTPLQHPVVLGVDASPGLRSAAVVLVGRRGDGLVHVEVVAHQPGTAWLDDVVPSMARKLGARVAHLAGRAPVAAAVPGWGLTEPEMYPMGDTEFAAACGGMDKLVTDQGLRHLGSPALAGALSSAVRKQVGDGSWVLSRTASGGDICPAVAMTVGLRVLATGDQSAPVFLAI